MTVVAQIPWGQEGFPRPEGATLTWVEVWVGKELVLRLGTRFPGILNVLPSHWLHWGNGSCYGVTVGR